MSEKIRIVADKQFNKTSNYRWINIELEQNRIGKARIYIDGNKLIINSINIFPEYERNGYARNIVKVYQQSYDVIIADRVRPSAIQFWEKMGFNYDENGNYVWYK